MKKDKPLPGVEYHLTCGPGQPSIANGNTWEEAKVEDEKEKTEEQTSEGESKDESE